jgi:hypothetical protein
MRGREVKAIQYERKACCERLRGLCIDPITVTAKGVVVNGHARVLAARSLGLDEVQAVVIKHPDYRRIQSGDC